MHYLLETSQNADDVNSYQLCLRHRTQCVPGTNQGSSISSWLSDHTDKCPSCKLDQERILDIRLAHL